MSGGDALRYDVVVDPSDEDSSHGRLARLTGPGKKVLEVGPATGYLTKILRDAGCSITAVEIDAEAASVAEQYCERMIVGDIETLDFEKTFGDERFDVVIYGDVLEHLNDPETTLVRTKEVLASEGYVIASIPNVTHGSVRLALLVGRFRYTEMGILDRTHLRFYDRHGVEELFAAAGYSIEEWRDTENDPFNTELELREEDFPRHLVDTVRRAPDSLVYQFVTLARPSAAASKPRSEPNQGEPLATLWSLEQHAENLEGAVEHLRDGLQAAQKDREREIEELEADRDADVWNRDQEIQVLRGRVERLENTSRRRLKRRIVRFVDRIAPWGTRRRSVLLTPSRLLRARRTEGWGAFLRELALVWKWVPKMFVPAYPRIDRLSPSQLYTLWLEQTILSPKLMREARRAIRTFQVRPTVSIVMPTYNTRPGWLRLAVGSVLGQIYEDWQLCIVDDGSSHQVTLETLREIEGSHPRIEVRYLEANRGIVAASNAGLEMASGELVGFLDHDDELKENALYEVVKALNADPSLDFIYSDEDKKEGNEGLSDPFFKPDWSPDLLTSVNYVTHFAVYRREILDRVGGFREGFDGSQDYDLALRVTELSDRVGHIPVPIYTWRKIQGSAASEIDAKPAALETARRALAEALERRGHPGRVDEGLVPGRYRVRYEIKGEPKVTIIIPTRDKVALLDRCIRSIRERTSYTKYDVVIVDNESRERETLDYMAAFRDTVIRYPYPFNYARMMNTAVDQIEDTDFILFLNNDTSVIEPGWIEALVEHGQRAEVGATGARLLYPSGRPQHEGIALNYVGTAGNVDFGGHDGMGETVRNCSAVTGACMLMRPDVFAQLGGFEERLGVAFNDVDLCLRIREKGYQIVYTPHALLYHHESATRRALHPEEDELFFRKRWGEPTTYQDPYYSPNFDPQRPFELRLPAAFRR
ncbi:MAG: glycosyltransferase [Actinomycetota bacterium]